MAEYVTREEFEARVGALEQEVDGEKLVSRYILEQTRRNGDDLASLKTRMDRVETRLDGVERNVGDLGKEMRGLAGKLDGLVKNLPGLMRDVMREVLQERGKKG
jgi:hypothetical protein